MLIKSSEILKDVLDQYYSWLVMLLGPKGKDKIALLGTITTLDVIKDAPLFTEGVFRSFADRTITVSPEDFGGSNATDRYSRIYSAVISRAAAVLYASTDLDEKQTLRLSGYQGDLTEATTEINSIRTLANKAWKEVVKDESLKPETPEWRLARANFYIPYLLMIKEQRNKITRARASIEAFWNSIYKENTAAAHLSEVYERCISAENLQYLPLDETIEKTYKFDPITIAEAAEGGLYPFEKELGMSASGSLTKILDLKGSRDLEIKDSTKIVNSHDKDWGGGGDASWIPIFSISGSDTNEESFRQSISNIQSINIQCDYLGDYWVRRRDWYDSSILTNRYVKAELKKNKKAAALLAMCISSMVIVRGLKVTYKFKSINDTQIWSNHNFDAGGGFNVFGINFGDVRAGHSESSYTRTIDTEKNSVTFSDGADVCRLLALRTSSLVDEMSQEQIAFETRYLEDTKLGLEVIDAWRDGAVPYGLLSPDIQKARIFSEDGDS